MITKMLYVNIYYYYMDSLSTLFILALIPDGLLSSNIYD
jgi:hypothetical protein